MNTIWPNLMSSDTKTGVKISVLVQTKWHALFSNVTEADDAHFHGCLHLELTLGIPRGLSITTGSGIM
ncbi:hypothetical protein BDL97_14G070700 [Sphagnum fallax]|nr:hypothetical protein BDL97_14G070700 [Sphagnum fallax]